MAAFLNRQGGADVLAAALGRHVPPADSAKLALRAVYALGRADPALVATLSRAAGLSAETKPLTPAELNQLVAEVAAHGDPARGELIFRRADLNCMSCHSLSKAGGEVGPDLSAVGQTSPSDYIINSILNPDQAIKEQYHTLVVQTSDGQVFQGIVTDKDDQRIVLKEATGTPRVVPVASIEDQKPGGSLMPKGLANLMTHAEFVDLVRFLSELGKPGPYAIRTTPTIQRWRVLKPVSAALATSIPDKDLFRDQVLKAEPGRWTTAYAKVAGALPLDELTAQTGSKVLYLQGEINVSNAGPIRVQLDSAEGVRFWVDRRTGSQPMRTALVDDAGRRPPYGDASGRRKATVVTRDQSRGHQAERIARRVHGGRRALSRSAANRRLRESRLRQATTWRRLSPPELGLGPRFHELMSRMHDVVRGKLAEQVRDLLVKLVAQLGLDGLHQGHDPIFLRLQLARVDLAVGHRLEKRAELLDVFINQGGVGFLIQPVGSTGPFAIFRLAHDCSLG